jgi:membrane protein required for colicin V production
MHQSPWGGGVVAAYRRERLWGRFRLPQATSAERQSMHWQQWTFLDIVFVVIILVSTGFAVRKGLAREAISLVALVGGFILAAIYYPVPSGWFAHVTKTQAIADLIGFLTIFLSCLLVGAVAAFFVNRFIKMAALEWIDRLMGGIFGLLRGWAVASIIALALIAFPVRPELMAQSVFAPYLLAGARAAVLLVPKDLKDKFYAEYQRILKTWNENRSPV